MSVITQQANLGHPLNDELIIDCHTHMGPWNNFHLPNGSAEGMLAIMDRVGIDITCVTAMASVGPDYVYGNNIAMAAATKYPERFIAYVTINPNYPNDMQHEFDRCFAGGARAIKLHPAFHGCPIDYKTFHLAYETAEERSCPVLIHTWGRTDMAIMDKLAAQYPRVNFIMGHAGAQIRAMEDAIDITNKHSNVFVDLALSLTYEGNVEWLVGEMGSERVLFGSDMPFFDPRPTFGRIAMAQISDDEKRDVLGLNMKRLLKIWE